MNQADEIIKPGFKMTARRLKQRCPAIDSHLETQWQLGRKLDSWSSFIQAISHEFISCRKLHRPGNGKRRLPAVVSPYVQLQPNHRVSEAADCLPAINARKDYGGVIAAVPARSEAPWDRYRAGRECMRNSAPGQQGYFQIE